MDPLGNSFCGLVENDEEIGKFVLSTLTACIQQDEKWRKRVMDANPLRLKSIVKTMVLQWKWCRLLVDFCKSKPIMEEEKMTSDFKVIETAFRRMEALQVKEDRTGKKANLHPVSLEIWNTCHKILNEQEEFNTFQSAQALNLNFQNTVQTESLQNLCVPNCKNPWTDAHTQFVGQAKNEAAVLNDENENEEAGSATHMQLPTRAEAIKVAAKNELDLFHGTSFVRTGDVARDKVLMFQSEITKQRTNKNAQWNAETKGNRRAMIYDEKGRREPKWAYVCGRNQWRSKVCFMKDDFERYVELWEIMVQPGDVGDGATWGSWKEKVDVFWVWNAEQERASAVIMKKLKSIPGLEGHLKKTLLKGCQAHVERRLWDGTPEGTVGDLAGLPGMEEQLFCLYAGPLPSRRKHKLVMGGIQDNMYPEEIIPLRNPKKSEPVVPMEVKKAIFPPDDDKPHDGERVVRSDEVWAPCHVAE